MARGRLIEVDARPDAMKAVPARALNMRRYTGPLGDLGRKSNALTGGSGNFRPFGYSLVSYKQV